MKPMISALLLLSTPFLGAQDRATTLAAACDKSAVIVLATVTAATDPSPAWHRLVFRSDEVLSGQVAAQFTLLEPAGACCGRSLFALNVGDQRLMFLTRTGATMHLFGGARGVLSPDPAVLAHVRALLSSPAPATRAQLLASSLEHPVTRIALDAAHALAAMPTLVLSAPDLARVTHALELAVHRGWTQAAPLVDITVRHADATTIDAVLPLYLREARADRASLLRRGLSRMPPALLIGRLPAHLGQQLGKAGIELRAAQLLRKVPGHHGQAALSVLLRQTSCPRVQLCASEALLSTGTPANALRSTVPAPILELAERRIASVRFRSIDPRRR